MSDRGCGHGRRDATTQTARALIAAGGLLVCCSLLASLGSACTPQKRYRVLSTFFDGVPDPDAPAREVTAPEEIDPAAIARQRREANSQPVFYKHRPVAERRCNLCHNIPRIGSRRRSFGEIGPSGNFLRKSINELCFDCHRLDQPFQHGPAATGDCTICHITHGTPFPHMVRVAEPRTLCIQCHDLAGLRERGLHEQPEDIEAECTHCHNPHQSTRRAFIKADDDPPMTTEYEPDED